MAAGDLTVFNEARAYMIDGGWEPTDDIKCAILDNTTAPTAADTAPELADYTQVGSAGSYVSGGTSLGNLGTLVSESGGTMTFDSSTNPVWAADASNDTDAYFLYVYNATQSGGPGIAFVELGGPVNMATISLQANWNASGLFTI